jgi:hypothetical protein
MINFSTAKCVQLLREDYIKRYGAEEGCAKFGDVLYTWTKDPRVPRPFTNPNSYCYIHKKPN